MPVAALLWLRRAIAIASVLAAIGPAFATGAGDPGVAHPQAANAGAGETYAISRHTIDAGGGSSSGGGFAIEGTIGQPDADPLQPATGGGYALTGGYWTGAAGGPRPDAVFANGFEG